ncbi:PBP1A family penicillin-binding protein, partial [Bacillus sp. MN7755]
EEVKGIQLHQRQHNQIQVVMQEKSLLIMDNKKIS